MPLQFVGDQIKNAAITNDHLSGSVQDSKLLQIVTANKVAGSAIELASGGALENDSGLKISATSITDGMLQGNISFSKLADSAQIARLDQNETVTGTYAFNAIPSCSVSASSANHLTNKSYVDSVAQGLHPKETVKAATTGNITLSGTQTVDGIALGVGDRCLVWQQTDQTTNGVYVVAAGSWARSSDMDAGSEFPGASMFSREGSTYGTTGFVCSNPSVTLGSTNVTFVQYTGTGQIGAGDGIAKSGSTLSVDLSTASGLEFSGGKLQMDIQASKAIQLASNELTLVLDGTTLEQSGSGIKVKTQGISDNEISNSAAIADTKLATISTGNKVSGSAVQVNGSGAITNDSGLKVNTDGVQLRVSSSNALEIIPTSITNALISNSAAIADTKLAQITTGNKVAGSSVELKSNGGLSNSSGLTVDVDGVNIRKATANGNLEIVPASIGNALISNSAAIVDTKLAQITTADKVAGSAVSLKSDAAALEDSSGLRVKVDGLTIDINSDAIRVMDDAIGLAKIGARAKEDQFDISGGSTTSVTLTQRIQIAAWRVAGNIMVFRNGQKLRYNASPSTRDQFSISDNGSATSITFGAAQLNGDAIDVCYMH